MTQLDRRLSAIYVDVEDRSFSGVETELDRAAFVVILSDRGPDRRVVETNDWDKFKKLYGPANFIRTGHGHYFCRQHLKRARILYTVRPVSPNSTLSNAIIKYNDPSGSIQLYSGKFSFTNDSDTVVTDKAGLTNMAIGDYVYAAGDTATNREKIINIVNDDDSTTYTLQLEHNYTGSTTVDLDIYKYYNGVLTITEDFVFTDGSNVVTASDPSKISLVKIGDWVFPVSSTYEHAYQIIEVNTIDGEFTIDKKYVGTTVTENLKSYVPFQTINRYGVEDIDYFQTLDADNVYYFYANGVGEYYDNLFIKGVRNVEYESIYINDDGDPLYKYAFMTIGIYEKFADGNISLVEGPWNVSLIEKTKDDIVIRDVVTGRDLYIESVINQESDLFSCKSGLGVDVLLNAPDAELKRLQIMTMINEGDILKLNIVGEEGIQFDGGSCGDQYDSFGRLTLTTNTVLRGLVAQAYNGTLTSVDGSIENITQSIYPWFIFNYVYAGGYDSVIQNAARELVDLRDDCLLLGDTGYNSVSPDEDLNYRRTVVAWNTYNAMLYVQYREIDDIETGHKVAMSPVYHAIDRHLYCDDKYWLAEPVANIEKGAIQEPIKLSYVPSWTKMGDLNDAELNVTILEPDGIYFINQFTTWKRLSILKRAHAIKFIHYLKQSIPKLLKDIIQRKATEYWLNQAHIRLNNHMNKFLDSGSYDRFVAITWFKIQLDFDNALSELNILLSLKLIRAIEKINVRLIAY